MLVDFYHLASTPLEQVLPGICETLLADGERLLIVARPDLLGAIDGQLWSYARDAFLPHGRSDKESPQAQPILLSAEPEALNGAKTIALADGEWRDAALGFDRTFYFFGNDRLDAARASWRELNARPDVECRYWKPDGAGEWVQGP